MSFQRFSGGAPQSARFASFLLPAFPLAYQRGDQVQAMSNSVCFCDLLSTPLGCTPIKGLSLVNDMIERAYNLLHGCIRIGSVSKE